MQSGRRLYLGLSTNILIRLGGVVQGRIVFKMVLDVLQCVCLTICLEAGMSYNTAMADCRGYSEQGEARDEMCELHSGCRFSVVTSVLSNRMVS